MLFMSVDHRHPGWYTARPTAESSSMTTSACPLGNVRTSSDDPKLLY